MSQTLNNNKEMSQYFKTVVFSFSIKQSLRFIKICSEESDRLRKSVTQFILNIDFYWLDNTVKNDCALTEVVKKEKVTT